MLPEESAISGEFTAALSLSWGLSNQEQIRALERPFSKAWIKSWDEIAETKGWVLAGTNLAEMPGYKRKTPEMFPGASGRFRRFKVDDGLEFLKILTAKGANPNLILSLLIKYLWNDDVSRTEHSSLRIKELRKQLEAVQKTKGLYLRHVKQPFESLQKTQTPFGRVIEQWLFPMWVNVYGYEPSGEVEMVLCEMEKKIKNILWGKDFGASHKRPASDKVNRVIFTIHEHLKRQTKNPQWEIFWNMLVSAKAIKGGGSLGNKDGQIKHHIKLFQKDHNKEVRTIRGLIVPPSLNTLQTLFITHEKS